MRVFVLFCFAVNFAASEVKEIDCIESFVGQKSTESSECETVVGKLTTDFEARVKNQLTADDNQTCIMKVFDDYKISQLYLRGFANQLRNPVEKYVEDVDESIDALMNAAKVICIDQATFSSDFDQLFNIAKTSEPSMPEKCVLKYFIDENVIDEKNFNMNLSNLNETLCKGTVKELKENFSLLSDEDESSNTFFGLSASKAQVCTNQKFKEFKVVEKIFSFQIMSSYGEIEIAQKEKLRLKYIDARTSSVKFLFECMKDI